ncbi:carboxylesterase 4A-like [Asterias amurensis]|uniref:carboxylesterase 4A-like n=1 Tax=Asterias amurensis TaxID=7602 RepID=UPI003AB4404E
MALMATGCRWQSIMLLGLATFIICSYVTGVNGADGDEAPIVKLGKSSSVQGLILKALESPTPVYNFRGIYYAAPPTGKRRFGPPARRKPFEGLSDGTRFGPLCPQNLETTERVFRGMPFPTREMNEDCLHLNIYTPDLDEKAKLAVMVHFSGGAFANGGGGFYDGTALAAHHQVVVVTVNTRLGALGFLSTSDVSAMGNYGLLDQGVALHWIGSHIKQFGGDPDRITIMGESSGAMSVSLQLMFSLSEGLFHQVIAQSGVATSPIALVRDPRELAEKLGTALKCPTDNSRILVDCLRQKPADKIARVKLVNRPIEFGPVVDGIFLRDDPRTIQTQGKIPRKNVLLGFNSDEGGGSLLDTRVSSDLLNLLSQSTFSKFLEQMLYLVIPKSLPAMPLVRAITNMYVDTEGTWDDDQAQQYFSDIITDCVYVAPAVSTADALSERGFSVFMYEFEHRSGDSTLPSWAKADHGDEEAYVWGEPFMDRGWKGPEAFTEEEKELSQKMMLYWTNFAKYGNPNGVSKPQDSNLSAPYWSKYTRADKKYMQLDNTPQEAQNIKSEKVLFWNKLFSFWKLGKRRREEL